MARYPYLFERHVVDAAIEAARATFALLGNKLRVFVVSHGTSKEREGGNKSMRMLGGASWQVWTETGGCVLFEGLWVYKCGP